MSHTIIIRGGEYAEGTPPEGGHASVEVRYSPTHGLTPQQQGANVAKLIKLVNKIYAIESEPEE